MRWNKQSIHLYTHMHTNICAQSIQSVSQGAILSGLLSLDALREKTELNIFHEKYFRNRYVFKADLNEDMESLWRMSNGNEFHTSGAQKEKERSPSVT